MQKKTWYLTLRGPVSQWDGRIIRWELWLPNNSVSVEMWRQGIRACQEQHIPYKQTDRGLEIAHYALKAPEGQ